MTEGIDSRGTTTVAEEDRRIAEVVARNGRPPAPVVIRRVGDEPPAEPERKPAGRPDRKPLSTAERVRILDRRAEGATFAAIAREVGCSEPTVRRIVNSRDVEPVQEPRPGAESAPVAPLVQALAILDGELERLDKLRGVRDRLADLIH